MMNRRARQPGLRDALRPPGRARALGHVSSARDVTTLARVMRKPLVREIVTAGRQRSPGPPLAHLERPARQLPRRRRREDGAHVTAPAGLRRQPRGGPGVTVYATSSAAPAAGRNADLIELMTWGSRFRGGLGDRRRPPLCSCRDPYGRGQVALVAPRSALRAVRVDRPLVERVVAPVGVEPPVRKGQRLGEVRGLRGGASSRVLLW